MKLFKVKETLYQDLQLANAEIQHLEQVRTELRETIAELREIRAYYSDNLENVYNTFKTIKSLTKDKTIETICVLKMQDLANMYGLDIPSEE